MDQMSNNVAATLNAMPETEIQKFVHDSMQSRKLGHVVRQLNREALSKKYPESDNASKALKRLGFTD